MRGEDLRNRIVAREVVLGKDVVLEHGVTISGNGGPAERVVLGDNVYVGENTKIRTPVLEIGDFTQIHNHGLVYGLMPIRIGHNGWFGQNTIINATETVIIGDNCGVGAYSQLWTHIAYGDVMAGCRFHSAKPLTIGKDVWFVGHCIVSPIVAHDRSLAMVGSVITRDMEENHVYAGCPAKDVTDKLGPQFQPSSVEQRVTYMKARLEEFAARSPDWKPGELGLAVSGVVVVAGETLFDVADRTYNKRRTETEVAFMRFLLPDAKFTPCAR
jgi:acetyltransferase-like isoleucine patch superfamily enzyme